MKDYIKQAMRTNAPNDKAVERLQNNKTVDILHAFMGLSTEANELLDMLKKHIFYGKEIDYVNTIEELGDIFWYAALICDSMHIDFEEVLHKNIEKLKKRYPEKFSNEKALNRDLEEERKVLENKKRRI
jgi:NTP pyrophosphatase (non-canonical NTP hydrolase)